MTEIILIFAPEDEERAALLSEALSALGVALAPQPLTGFNDAVRMRIEAHAAALVCWSRRSVHDDGVLDAALCAANLSAGGDGSSASRYLGVILDDTLRALLPKPFFMKDAAPLVAWFEASPHPRYDDPPMARLLQTIEALTGRTDLTFVAQALDARLSDETGHVADTLDAGRDGDATLPADLPAEAAAEPIAADPQPSGLPPDVAAILSWTEGAVAAAASPPPVEEPEPTPEEAAPAPPEPVAPPPEIVADAEPAPTPTPAAEPSSAATVGSAPLPIDAPAQTEPEPAIAAPDSGADSGSPTHAEADDQDGLISELQMQLAGLRIQRGFETSKFQDQDAKFAQLQSDLAAERSAVSEARAAAAQANAVAADAAAAAQHALAEAASLRAETSKLVRAVEEARQAYASALRHQKALEAQVHAGDQTLREVMMQREELLAARAQWEKNGARSAQELAAVTAKFNEAENARKTYELALLDRKTEILSLQSQLEAAGANAKPVGPAPALKAANDPGSTRPDAAKPSGGWDHVPWRSIAAVGVFAGVMLSYAAISTNQMVADWFATPPAAAVAQPSAPAAPPLEPAGAEPPPAQTAQTDIAVTPDPSGAPVAEPETPPLEGPLGVPVSDQVLFNPDGLPPPDPDTRPPPQDLPPMQQKPRLLLKPPAPAEP